MHPGLKNLITDVSGLTVGHATDETARTGVTTVLCGQGWSPTAWPWRLHAAVLHDLANQGDKDWGLNPPYRQLGLGAVQNAAADFALGRIGAGRGARAAYAGNPS